MTREENATIQTGIDNVSTPTNGVVRMVWQTPKLEECAVADLTLGNSNGHNDGFGDFLN